MRAAKWGKGMFIERRINPSTSVVELWECQWENDGESPAHKVYLKKIGVEQSFENPEANHHSESKVICWSYGRTLGNIAVFSESLIGSFPAAEGTDAQLPCDIVNAGKFRHGADRWWCRTHQTHWGIKADHAAYAASGVMQCANHDQYMNYVVDPFSINVSDNAEVGVWCSMPAAISTEIITSRPPKIHIHVRQTLTGKKLVDRDFNAVTMLYSQDSGLFASQEITHVNITPPAAFDFVYCLEREMAMDCVNCATCGYPHLDLGDFARAPHRKHFCGNCGRDSTWSKTPIVSTPLQPLHDKYAHTLAYEVPDRELNLDSYPGCTYTVWASTPAILWTAHRAQEFGIHVHVHEGRKRIVDDTFGRVMLNGQWLERADLVELMMERTVL